MVSMQDIADRLGVSRSTVSLVLSGKAGSRVSEEVKKKVFQVARELHYHVNDVARSLRTGASKLIGAIVTDISNEFFGRLTFHIQEEAKKAGYLVLTVNTNEDPRDFEETVRVLIGKQVDGIIAVPPPGGDDTVAYIKEMGVPVVTVDRPGVGVDFVGIDNYASSRSAVEGLLLDGFRSISLVALDLDIDPLNQRRDAYVDAMKERGLGDKIDIRLIPFGREEEYDIPSLLKGLRNVDAVYFTSRRAFTQGMAHLAITGQILPEDQCLLCFDDVQPYLTVHSNIRYVEQPVGEMAGKAFDLLMEQIRGERIPGRYIFPTRCISNRKY
jgi:LacI family transcriptional regulator